MSRPLAFPEVSGEVQLRATETALGLVLLTLQDPGRSALGFSDLERERVWVSPLPRGLCSGEAELSVDTHSS